MLVTTTAFAMFILELPQSFRMLLLMFVFTYLCSLNGSNLPGAGITFIVSGKHGESSVLLMVTVCSLLSLLLFVLSHSPDLVIFCLSLHGPNLGVFFLFLLMCWVSFIGVLHRGFLFVVSCSVSTVIVP